MKPYRCVTCGGALSAEIESWHCDDCGKNVDLYHGEIPVFYELTQLAGQDASLKKNLYDGFLGKFYSFLMPFLSLPVRPINRSGGQWLLYILVIGLLLMGYANLLLIISGKTPELLPVLSMLIAFALTAFALRNTMFGWLMVLAVPLKLNHLLKNFTPKDSFTEIHEKTIKAISGKHKDLKVLDVSTGTCNSLIRHGWLGLNAEFYGIDLSETMLVQGQQNCRSAGVTASLALADACNLPFDDAYFDVVLNYGAINGYSDVDTALKEMYRVVKPEGTMVLYDEQLYDDANFLEKLYFNKVLSPHDVIHHCPTSSIPEDASYKVDQVYPYYFLCVIEKPS